MTKSHCKTEGMMYITYTIYNFERSDRDDEYQFPCCKNNFRREELY